MAQATTAQAPMLGPNDLGPADEEILSMLREGRVTAPFVAEETGYSLQYVRDRLRRMVEHGHVHKPHEGLYELTDDPAAPGTDTPAPDQDAAAGQDSPDAGDVPDDQEGDGRDAAADADAESERDAAEARLRAMDLSGSGTDYKRRVAAVLSMYDHLRDNPGERFSRGDLEGVLDGVDVGYSGGFSSLWTNFVKSNASQGREENTLTALPGVEARGSDYVYTEGEE